MEVLEGHQPQASGVHVDRVGMAKVDAYERKVPEVRNARVRRASPRRIHNPREMPIPPELAIHQLVQTIADVDEIILSRVVAGIEYEGLAKPRGNAVMDRQGKRIDTLEFGSVQPDFDQFPGFELDQNGATI